LALVKRFITHIGRKNANLLGGIRIHFPEMPNLEEGNIDIQSDSFHGVIKVQMGCCILRIPGTSSETTNVRKLQHAAITVANMVFFGMTKTQIRVGALAISADAVALLDAHSRMASSQIFVKIYGDGAGADVPRMFESHGWIV
jgi:hypothetical protein